MSEGVETLARVTLASANKRDAPIPSGASKTRAPTPPTDCPSPYQTHALCRRRGEGQPRRLASADAAPATPRATRHRRPGRRPAFPARSVPPVSRPPAALQSAQRCRDAPGGRQASPSPRRKVCFGPAGPMSYRRRTRSSRPSPAAATSPATKFIDGDPMKPATKVLAGLS